MIVQCARVLTKSGLEYSPLIVASHASRTGDRVQCVRLMCHRKPCPIVQNMPECSPDIRTVGALRMLIGERTMPNIRGVWVDPLAKGRRAEWRPGSIPGHLALLPFLRRRPLARGPGAAHNTRQMDAAGYALVIWVHRPGERRMRFMTPEPQSGLPSASVK